MAPPFTVNTVVRDDLPASADTAREVRARSARVYGRPRSEVDAEIAESLRPRASGPAPRPAPSSAAVGGLIKAVDAMVAARDSGNLMAECDACIHFARFCRDAGEAKAAMSALERVLSDLAKVKDERDQQIMRAIALTDIAKLQADADDFRQAEQNLLAALDLDRALKKVDWQVQDLRQLARVYRRLGDDARARAASEEAEKLAASQS